MANKKSDDISNTSPSAEEEKNPKGKYVDPLSDDGFKTIFRNKDILTAFLTDLLKPASPITDITYLDKEMLGDVVSERKAVYDFRCQTKDGSYFIVEMQREEQKFFTDRIIYYLSRSYSSQRRKGQKDKKVVKGKEKEVDWNYELAPVYGVFFLDYSLNGFEKRSVRTVQLRVDDTNEVFSEKLKAFILEVGHYRGEDESVCKTKIDYWLYILANMATMTKEIPFKMQQPAFEVLQRVAEYDNMTLEESRKYGMDEDDYLTTMACWNYKFEKGVNQGIQIGIEQGIQQGIQQGTMQERQKQLQKQKQDQKERAAAMKADGLPVETIIRYTGLTAEEIQGL